MEKLKPTQCYQRRIKLLMAIILAITAYGLYHVEGNSSPGKKPRVQEMTAQQRQAPVTNNSTYKHIKGILDLHSWTTANGTKVMLVPTPQLPILDIQMAFDAGSSRDNATTKGLAYITNQLLKEGTNSFDGDEIATRLDAIGAQFSSDSLRDMAIVHLRTLTDPKAFNNSMEVLASIISEPNFPEDAFAREKQHILTALNYEKQSPSKLAARAFYENLFNNSPYGNWVIGDNDTINSITPDMCKKFHSKFYTPSNLTLTFVGNITLEAANEAAFKLTANLPDNPKPEALPHNNKLAASKSVHLNFPSEQTHIYIGGVGIEKTDPDYYALTVGNHILGGGVLTSRIFDIVRNQHGLAYSAYSYFMPMQAEGPFIMNCQTRNDKAQDAKKIMQDVLQEFIKNGPTEDELKLAKQNLIGGYALHFDSNESISRQLLSQGFYNLPLDYFDQYKSKVEALTTKEIQQAFAKHLDANKLLFVTVGEKG